MMEPLITHQPAEGASRRTFDLMIDSAQRGHLSYSLPDDVRMVVEYVEVDRALRGTGLGETLVRAAVEWARAGGRRIVPQCSYARAVIERTPEYQDVLSTDRSQR